MKEKANDKSLTDDRRNATELIAVLQASPDRDIDLAPPRTKMPVRDARL